MYTSKFLDSVSKVLPAAQARNISNLMSDLKQSGAISNANEYNQELQKLITTINDSNPKPSFKQIRALIWSLISSQAHNAMVKYIQNDLDAIYLNTDSIGQKLDDHHVLLMQNIIADTERALMDQENNIRRLEWLASVGNDFSMAIVNSFVSSSLLRIPRTSEENRRFYFNNRTHMNVSESEVSSAVIDEYSQMLTLPIGKREIISPISVSLNDSDSSYGTIIQNEFNNPINNIIDNKQDTFWIRNLYYKDPVPYVDTVLDFDFGRSRDINSVIIDGASQSPFIVYAIVGTSPSGHKIQLLEDEQEIDGWGKIIFERHALRSVRVFFRTKTYIRIDGYTDNDTNAWYIDDTNITELDKINSISKIAYTELNSPNLASMLGISEDTSENISLYLYQLAVDNIWFENIKYKDTGIFVSSPLEGDNIGSCAVQAIENITGYGEAISPSIEYELIKVDTVPKYREYKVPIPKLNQSDVVSERFITTHKISSIYFNAGELRFCPYIDPNWTSSSDLPIHLYKNGDEIFLGQSGGFDISISPNDSGSIKTWISSWSDATDFSLFKYLPQKLWIKLRAPDPTASYTVSYKIRTSDSMSSDNTVWLSKDKTICLLDGGKIYFKHDDIVDTSSKIYLQITLRKNKTSDSVTPFIDEYALLGASYK